MRSRLAATKTGGSNYSVDNYLITVTKTETYKDHCLQPTLCKHDSGSLLPLVLCKPDAEPCWICHIELANGQRLLSNSDKSFPTVKAALDWAKETIDFADSPLSLSGQALEQQLDTASPHLMPHVDAMLHQYLPKATAQHKLLLKYLILQFDNQGTDHVWDYFLARAFAVTSRKFLSLCQAFVKVGLLRYWRFNQTYFMEFCLGSAWLSVEGARLTTEELSAIALGEQIASYRPWWKKDEQYPGEMLGFPCMENEFRNTQYFSQVLGIRQDWQLRHEGKALVRVPINPDYPTWYSTWQSGVWTHKSSKKNG